MEKTRGARSPIGVLTVMFLTLVGRGSVHAGDEDRYLKAVCAFADTVLEHGRDTYGDQHTVLFTDGLHVETLRPATWRCSRTSSSTPP